MPRQYGRQGTGNTSGKTGAALVNDSVNGNLFSNKPGTRTIRSLDSIKRTGAIISTYY